MSLGKKILFLFIALIILIIYTISTFNYKTISNDNQMQNINTDNKNLMFDEYEDSFVVKISKFKNSILEKLGFNPKNGINKNKKPIDFELIKSDGIVLMNGTFKNELQVKSIVDLLNINRNGNYIFEENRVKDAVLLNKLSLLIDSFKEFFVDGSKLSIEDGKILLKGELEDSNFKPLLNSIILKSKLNIIMDIKEPFKSNTDKVIDNISEEIKNESIELNIESEDKLNKAENTRTEVIDTRSKTVIIAQNSINELTSDNKITFKRRSTNITEESKSTITEIANILLANSKLNVEVGGHTDSRGRASLNKRISQDRANSVKNALVTLGVDPKRIKAVGYGEDFPIAKDDADGLSEINRRVEFIVGEEK
ncbi:OmpA family protein [Poseidonibacter antarcticus]|uniref:OmpA family protein n=1 Tax=Poseidonibacter antarcticus TaxID=2478538 RepID=UPI000EF4A217|nr:OmpA family protein [Poseidonibacter antarcticus]